nr:hypothetical protein [bacterium]
MKLGRKFYVIIALLVLVTMLVPTMVPSAEVPSHAYVYNSWLKAVPSPLMYVPKAVYGANNMALEDVADLQSPQDLFINKKTGEAYIADEKSNVVIKYSAKTMTQLHTYRGCYVEMSKSDTNRYKLMLANKIAMDPAFVGSYLRDEKVLDENGEPVLDENGDPVMETKGYRLDPFKSPKGVFVNNEGTIIVADQENARVVLMDQDGVMINIIHEPPASAALSSDFKFQPQKVVQDASNTLYVLCLGGNRGAFMFSPEVEGGEFLGFYGANRVRTSFRLLLDLALKRILPKQYRSSLGVYVPVEMSNLYIDDEGFIYAVTTALATANSTGDTDTIRKLNYKGTNTLSYRGESRNYGDLDVIRLNMINQVTQFTDVTVDERGFISAIDLTYGRVFQYDQEANQLVIQNKGRTGSMSQVGTTSYPTSIENYEGMLYVLDGNLKQVTTYELTEYGEYLQNAVIMYNAGHYEEAIDPWMEVLKRNANMELAYTGLGRAYMKKGEYKTALRYLRLGYDRVTYSTVYEEYRGAWITANFSLVAIVVILLILSPFAITRRQKIGAWFKRVFTKSGKR